MATMVTGLDLRNENVCGRLLDLASLFIIFWWKIYIEVALRDLKVKMRLGLGFVTLVMSERTRDELILAVHLVEMNNYLW